MSATTTPSINDRGHFQEFVSGSYDLSKVISFYSFSIGGTLSFPAYLTSFSDNYKSNWSTQELFGRMDPVSIYKNTTRQISVGIDVPSENFRTAIVNFLNLKYLIEALYPVYDSKVAGTTQISAPPFFRVLFSNMICKSLNSANNEPMTNGLLCYLDGFNFKPKLDHGFYAINDDTIHFYVSEWYANERIIKPSTKTNYIEVKNFLNDYKGSLIPKMVQAEFNMNIIHEVPLGQKVVSSLHTSRATNTAFATAFPNGIIDRGLLKK